MTHTILTPRQVGIRCYGFGSVVFQEFVQFINLSYRLIMIRLIRQDLEEEGVNINESYFEGEELNQELRNSPKKKNNSLIEVPMSEISGVISREEVIKKFSLPDDSILKISYEGKLIPWGMVELCESVEIRVVRPHQNVKPHISEGQSASDVLIKKKVKELEGRLASLEGVADPALISAKTERDLQLLTKQISFLGRRLEEADQAEWIKKT